MGVGIATEISIRQNLNFYLKEELGKDYKILEEISVKNGEQRYQIDMLVVFHWSYLCILSKFF
jgi:hypothetical protein